MDDEEGEDQPQCDAHQAFDRFGIWKGKRIEFTEPEECGQKNHQRENSGRTDNDQKKGGRDQKAPREYLLFGDFFHARPFQFRTPLTPTLSPVGRGEG